MPERRRGGRRPGAGRPKKPDAGVSHLRRPRLASRYPVHATWKVRSEIPTLRNKRRMEVIRRCFRKGCERFGFRLTHFSVQRDHIHLIGEAKDKRALSRGLQGLGVRIAKGLNKALRRKGKVFADRYHSHILETPREVRNALRYVLSNKRRHDAMRGEVPAGGSFDPCSSAAYFDGWKGRDKAEVVDMWMMRGPPLPICPARAWLLTTGWRRCGLIGISEVPGTSSRRRNALRSGTPRRRRVVR